MLAGGYDALSILRTSALEPLKTIRSSSDSALQAAAVNSLPGNFPFARLVEPLP